MRRGAENTTARIQAVVTRVFISCEVHKNSSTSAKRASEVAEHEEFRPYSIFTDASGDFTSFFKLIAERDNNHDVSMECSQLSAVVVDSRQEQH